MSTETYETYGQTKKKDFLRFLDFHFVYILKTLKK